MKRGRGVRLLARISALCALSALLSACASSCDKGSGAGTDAATLAADAAAETASRCTGPSAQRSLADVTEVGQVAVLGRSIAVGVLLTGDGGRAHQGVVLTDDTLSQVTVKDLGDALADAPPPRPFAGGQDLWVAFHPRASRDGDGGAPARRGVVLRAQKLLDGSGVVDFPRGPSGSMAFDVAFAKGTVVVAWEEDVARKGVIHLGRAGKGDIIVSPDSTDADDPKLLALADGRIVVAWTARRDEPSDAGLEHEMERPSEERSFHWAEAAFVDADKIDPALVKPFDDGGAPKPPFVSFRATPENGHVVAVELGLTALGPVAFVQDEGAESDGAGGRILSLALSPGQAKDLRVLVPRGVGHALFDYLPISGDGPAFVSFADVSEHQMLTVVGHDAPDSGATGEPTMDMGRPLAALPAGPSSTGERRVLALKVPGATTNGPSGTRGSAPELWLLACIP
jgi:hypothetical protein